MNDKFQQSLLDFDATIAAHPEYDEKTLMEKFPEFGGDASKLQSAYDYSATMRSGKYGDNMQELNSKFPEFFGNANNEEIVLQPDEVQATEKVVPLNAAQKQKKGFWTTPIGDFLEKFGAGVLDTIGGLGKIDEKVSESTIGKILFPQNIIKDAIRKSPLGDNQITPDDVLDAGQKLSEKGDFAGLIEDEETGVIRRKQYSDHWKEGKYLTALGDIMLTATESAPTSLLAMVPGAGLALVSASAAGQKYNELDTNPDTEEMPEWKKWLNATVSGSLEGATEKLGAKVDVKMIEPFMKKMTETTVKQILAKGGVNALIQTVTEGIEETLSQLGENVIDYATGVNETYDPFEGVKDAFVYGAGGGAQFGGVTFSMSGYRAAQLNAEHKNGAKAGAKAVEQIEVKTIDHIVNPILSEDVDIRDSYFPAGSKLDLLKTKEVMDNALQDHEFGFNHNVADMSEEDQKKVVVEVMDNETLNYEQKDTIINFVRAANVERQMRQMQETAFEEDNTNAFIEVRENTNHDTGTIVYAKFNNEEQPVVVVKGLAITEDGLVDIENSSDIVFYKDADGATKTTTADKIVGIESVSVEDATAISQQSVRSQHEAQRAEIDSIVWGWMNENSDPGEVDADAESVTKIDGEVIEDPNSVEIDVTEPNQQIELTPEQQIEQEREQFFSSLPVYEKGKKAGQIDQSQMTPMQTIQYFEYQFGEEKALRASQQQVEVIKKRLESESKKLENDPMNIELNESVSAIEEQLNEYSGYVNSKLQAKTDAYAEESKIRETQNAIDAEQKAQQKAIEEQNAIQAQLDGEAVKGVPDISVDKATDARNRGFRVQNGVKIDRQPVLTVEKFKETQRKFSTKEQDAVPVKRTIVDARQLQPSHKNGVRNAQYFIPETQPKERTDKSSIEAKDKIASNINPPEITGGITAYTGAPMANQHGEIIQGNGRTNALQTMYEGHPEQAQKYKQHLAETAHEYGMTADEVMAMEQPTAVDIATVEDGEAIRLGQLNAADTESGGKQRIPAQQTAVGLGDRIGNFAGNLFHSTNDDISISEVIDSTGKRALDYLHQLGLINNTQYESSFDDKGNITPEAKKDLQDITAFVLFNGANDNVKQMFAELPDKARKSILQTIHRDAESNKDSRIVGEIQQAIEAYNILMQHPEFASNTKYADLRIIAEQAKNQTQMFNSETELPLKKYSNFAIEMAILFKSETQKGLRQRFNSLYDNVQGKGGDMFAEAIEMSLEEAVKRNFNNIDYVSNREQIQRTDVGTDNRGSEQRQQRTDGDTGSREPNQTTEQSTDSGDGIADVARPNESEQSEPGLDPQTEEYTNEVDRLSKQFNTPIKVHTSSETITNQIALNRINANESKVKGWYDTNTGEVHIYTPHADSVEDVKETFFHEVIGHKGVRELLGEEKHKQLLNDIFDKLSQEKQDELLLKYGSRELAADEFISEVAERGEFMGMTKPTLLEKIVEAIKTLFVGAEALSTKAAERLANEVLAETARGLQASENMNSGSIVDVANSVLQTRLRETAKVGSESQDIKDKAQQDGTFMKAPNGELTNLNERQWLQTRTEAFKEWFGDWQNNPDEASKVVDDNGEPMVVYHGTNKDFTVFDAEKGNPVSNGGHYFSDNKELSNKFAGPNGKVVDVFLNIKNPNLSGFDGSGAVMSPSIYRDGGIFTKRNTDRYAEKGTKEYIVFNPNQIKSATENVGAFDNQNDDIRFRTLDDSAMRKEGATLSREEFIDRYSGSAANYRDGHTAPRSMYKESTIENRINDGDGFNLAEVSQGHHTQPDDYFGRMGARWYGYDDVEGMQSYRAIRGVMQKIDAQIKNDGKIKKMPTIKAYRAVPIEVDINRLIQGDWVTFSKEYAIGHGEMRFGENDYKVISETVPADQLWWDGNDINEWGFDDGADLTEEQAGKIWDEINTPTKSEKENAPLFRIIGEIGASRTDGAEMIMKDLSVAREMEKGNKTPKQVRLATGWERGGDGKWRYETEDFISINKDVLQTLSDNSALANKEVTFKSIDYTKNSDGTYNIQAYKKDAQSSRDIVKYNNLTEKNLIEFIENKDIVNQIIEDKGTYYEAFNLSEINKEFTSFVTAGDYLAHIINDKELFDAYPQLRDLIVEVKPDFEALAAYSKIDDMLIITLRDAKSNSTRSSLIHEIQHAIQDIEGFAEGSDMNNANYNLIAGEVEARNAQARMGMTEQQRRETLLSETEDVAREDQIVLTDALRFRETESSVDVAASEVDVNPTEGQKVAGNYKKGHTVVSGMNISIENPAGSVRSGIDQNGKEWEQSMNDHYGYFKNTKGKDGDHIDTFVKPGTNEDWAGTVYVVDQVDTNTKEFDESKVMLGYETMEEAKQAYMGNYEDGWDGFMAITPVEVGAFKEWLYDGAKQGKAYSEYKAVKEAPVPQYNGETIAEYAQKVNDHNENKKEQYKNAIEKIGELEIAFERAETMVQKTMVVQQIVDQIEILFKSKAISVVVNNTEEFRNSLEAHGYNDTDIDSILLSDEKTMGLSSGNKIWINAEAMVTSRDVLDTWIHETYHQHHNPQSEKVLSLGNDISEDVFRDILPSSYWNKSINKKIEEVIAFTSESMISGDKLPSHDIIEAIKPIVEEYLNSITDGKFSKNRKNSKDITGRSESLQQDNEGGQRIRKSDIDGRANTNQRGENERDNSRGNQEVSDEVRFRQTDHEDTPTRPVYKGETVAEYATKMAKYNDEVKFKVVPPALPKPPVLTSTMSFEEVVTAIALFKGSTDQVFKDINKEMSKLSKLYTEFVDRAAPLEKILGLMSEKGATLTDATNAYIDYMTSASKSTRLTQLYNKTRIEPLQEVLRKIVESEKLDQLPKHNWHIIDEATGEMINNKAITPYDRISLYLQARDIVEASQLEDVADRGEQGFENNVHDENGKGVKASEYIDMFEKAVGKVTVDKIWQKVRAVNQFALDLQLEYGLITQEVYDQYTNGREYYVPQRGWRERDLNDRDYHYINDITGTPDNPFNSALIKAKGRTTLAGDPLAYMQSIGESSIASALKNRTKQVFLEYAEENSDFARTHDWFGFKKVYYMATGVRDADGNMTYERTYEAPTETQLEQDKEVYEKLKENRDAMEGSYKALNEKRKSAKQHEATMRKLRETERQLQNLIQVKHTDSEASRIHQVTAKERGQHSVIVLKEGKEYEIIFSQNYDGERVANVLNRNFGGTPNTDLDLMGMVKQRASKLTRTMSALMTQYNPSFAIANGIRDWGTALISNLSEQGFEYTLQTQKNLFSPKTQSVVWQYVASDQFGKGEFFADNYHGQMLKEFFEDGSATGWSFLKDIDQLRVDMKRAIDPTFKDEVVHGQYGVNNAFGFKQVFGTLTEVSELNTRFAQYLTSREAKNEDGTPKFTRQEAATHAKEITVNFDRRGNNRFFSSLFSFFNAQIQGTNKMFRMVRNPKVRKGLITTFSAMMVGGILQALLQPDPDDEDNRQFTEWEQMTNFCFGKWKIPLPQGFRSFWGVGTQIGMAAKKQKGLDESLIDGVNFFFGELIPEQFTWWMNGFEIDEASGNLSYNATLAVRGAMPTSVQPAYDVLYNTNFMGGTSYRTEFTNSLQNTQSERTLGKQNVSAGAQWMSDQLFKIGGGDIKDASRLKKDQVSVVQGMWDINPSALETLFSGYGGGTGKFVVDMITLGNQIMDPEKEVDVSGMQIFNVIRKQPREYTPLDNEIRILQKRTNFYKNQYSRMKKDNPDGYKDLTKLYTGENGKMKRRNPNAWEQKLDEEGTAGNKMFDLMRESEMLLKQLEIGNVDKRQIREQIEWMNKRYEQLQ